MNKNRNINLPSLTPELFLALSLVLVLLAAVIYTSLGSPQFSLTGLQRKSEPVTADNWAADAARWETIAAASTGNPAPGLTRAQAAEAARLEALAKYYLPNVAPALTRAQAADAARLMALAEYYRANTAPALTRAQAAEAARLTGLAIFYGVEPASISPEVLAELGK